MAGEIPYQPPEEQPGYQSDISVSEKPAAEVIHPQPRVIYDERLKTSDCPYTVQVNAAALGDLLRTAGMPDERIRKMILRMQRKGILPGKGAYRYFTNSATLYTDRIWNTYEKLKQKAEYIATEAHSGITTQHTADPKKDPFQHLLVTRRLSHYLVAAPPERGIAFAQQLIKKARDRDVTLTVAHEVQHAVDEKNPKLMASSIARKGAIVLSGAIYEGMVALPLLQKSLDLAIQKHMPPTVAIPLALGEFVSQQALVGASELLLVLKEYQTDPLEKSARNFENTVRGDERWANIVTLTPKNTPQNPNV